MIAAKIIGVRNEPEGDGFANDIDWHIASVMGSDYVTACGLDGDDPMSGQYGTVEAKRGQRVTCQQCYQLWSGLRDLRLRSDSFSKGAKE